MKKLLNIRFDKKQCYEEDGKIYVDFLPKTITVDKVMEDGSYLCHYDDKLVYFKKTDKGDYYTNLFGKIIDPFCFVSDELDSVFVLVSRNANTSIVLSGLFAEGHKELENYSNDKFLWHDNNLMMICRLNGYIKPLSEVIHKNFKNHYFVIDEPKRRFIRALNKILIEPSLLKVDEDLKEIGREKEFIDEMLYFGNLCENDEYFIWERHLGLQNTYYEKCKEFYPNWTFIKLSDLPQWWEKTFNSKWLKNNVSSPQQKRLSYDDLNEEQKRKLDDFVKKDTELWNNINA